jgi:hypothetical protein
VPGQKENLSTEARRNFVGRCIGGLRSFDLRWPQFGRTLPILPQVAIGSYGIRDVMPSPVGDFVGLAFGTASVWIVNACIDGVWPFKHHDEQPPALNGVPPISPLDNKHLDS